MIAELRETLDKAIDYHETVLEVKSYLEYNEVTEQAHILYFLLMGLVWKSTERHEKLLDEDAEVYLGIEPGTLSGVSDLPAIPEMSRVPLTAYLDYLNDTYFKK